jgi:hypothetical protein
MITIKVVFCCIREKDSVEGNTKKKGERKKKCIFIIKGRVLYTTTPPKNWARINVYNIKATTHMLG